MSEIAPVVGPGIRLTALPLPPPLKIVNSYLVEGARGCRARPA